MSPKNYKKEVIPSSLPSEGHFVYSAQSIVNFFWLEAGGSTYAQSPGFHTAVFLIADSHFIAKPFSSVGPAWGA